MCGFCAWSLFCNAVFCAFLVFDNSFYNEGREGSFTCIAVIVSVMLLFLVVLCINLWYVIRIYPDHNLLSFMYAR